MAITGGCRCGSIRYELTSAPDRVSICYCSDCCKSAGAPMVSWAAFPEAALAIVKGTPKTHNSSGKTLRGFCGECGTGLFYRNAEFLPGIVDVQSITFDDPGRYPPESAVQTAERVSWVEHVHDLRGFARYPGG
jgi:hypothetical protein